MKERESDDCGAALSSIGDVVELLKPDYPSVTASSLRFLERIGLVTPQRTPGGHRLYRPQDVARVRTIKRMQDQRFTLDEIAARLLADDDGALINLEEFLSRALAGDEAGAMHLVTSALSSGLTPPDLFDTILSPALREVGERWAAGTITVAQEHAASEIIRDLVAIAGANRSDPAEARAKVVAAAVAHERHIIGLKMVTTLLRQQGVPVLFLGADVDPAFMVDAVLRSSPDVVLLTATMDDHLPSVEATIAAVNDAGLFNAPTIVVGGLITRRHADRLSSLGAIVVEDQTPGEAAKAVRRVMSFSPA
jgi:methanogenic corrinoid protein MtbC1